MKSGEGLYDRHGDVLARANFGARCFVRKPQLEPH